MIDGIIEIVHLFVDRRQRSWQLFIGLVTIIAGGYILMYPVLVSLDLLSCRFNFALMAHGVRSELYCARASFALLIARGLLRVVTRYAAV